MKAAVRRLVRADPGDRWAAVFGRIAVYSLLVALVSGILLLPFFRPSMTPVSITAPTASWTASRCAARTSPR